MGLKKVWGTVAVLALQGVASAHFLLLIPDSDIKEHSRIIRLQTEFTHPAEGGPAMHYQIEKSGAFVGGKIYPLKWKKELIPALPGGDKMVEKYETTFRVFRPGVYQFFVKQKPYFEPAEEKFIQQIAKVYVDTFNLEEGWDKPVGLKVEIVPITRPFGLWEGNTFKGRVLINGKPAANVDVEVEYYNTKGYKYPKEALITQVVKTDDQGYFVYTVPWSGWWGFSAITDGGTLKNPADGKEYPLELDAVLWIYAYPKPQK
jgi:cobalt/nickel transport protein